MKMLIELLARAAQNDLRVANAKSYGRVTDVGTGARIGMIRVEMGENEDGPVKSPWIKWGQAAGALKLHSLPSVGQQVTVDCPNGDWEQAAASPFTWSDDNPSPSDKVDEHVLTFGPWTITLKGDELSIKGPKVVLECDGTSFELTGAGLKMVAADYDFQ